MDTDKLFKYLMAYSASSKREKEKKLKPSERLLLDIEGYGFNMSQLKDVLETKGNQLIISCAGSGKTTGLIFKIIYDIKTGRATRVVEVNGNPIRIPEKTWVCTFLKTGAEELESSLIKWQRRLHCVDVSKSISFSTLHAEFKRVLNQCGITTNIVSASDNSKYLKEAVKGYALRNEKNRPLNAENFRDLEGALTYTRNRLDEKRYIQDAYDNFNIGPVLVDAILRDWKALRIQNKVMDFEDMQERLYEECYTKGNQEVIQFLSDRYNYIYIDEFQDTSQIQYALLKLYCSGVKQVVAIGDDDQTIYSWRGSYNGIITREFVEDFSPVKTELSVNYRCPSKILNAIKPSIECNKVRYQKSLKSYKEGGIVRYGEYANYRLMASALSDMILQDVQQGMSVAVLCRVNSDGLTPALILDKMGNFSFSISGEGMTLDSYIGRLVLGIIKLFTEKSTQAVKNSLSHLTWDTYKIDNLMKVCKANKISFWEIDSKDLSYSCPDIAEILLKWRRWREDLGDIPTLKLVLQDYRTQVFNEDSQFNDVVKSVISSIESLLDFCNYDSVEDFLIELEDINDRLKGRQKISKSVQVRIATVHEFKGKEADSVYVWNDSEHVFPYKKSLADSESYEEERRIHYIACTRARKQSTVMCLRNRKGSFVSEMDLSEAEKVSDYGMGEEPMGRFEKKGNMQKFEESCLKDDDSLYEENPFWNLDDPYKETL